MVHVREGWSRNQPPAIHKRTLLHHACRFCSHKTVWHTETGIVLQNCPDSAVRHQSRISESYRCWHCVVMFIFHQWIMWQTIYRLFCPEILRMSIGWSSWVVKIQEVEATRFAKTDTYASTTIETCKDTYDSCGKCLFLQLCNTLPCFFLITARL